MPGSGPGTPHRAESSETRKAVYAFAGPRPACEAGVCGCVRVGGGEVRAGPGGHLAGGEGAGGQGAGGQAPAARVPGVDPPPPPPHARARTRTHARTHARTHTHARAHKHTHTHTRAHTHKHTHKHTHQPITPHFLHLFRSLTLNPPRPLPYALFPRRPRPPSPHTLHARARAGGGRGAPSPCPTWACSASPPSGPPRTPARVALRGGGGG